MNLLARVAQMDRREVAFRGAAVGREWAQRVSTRVRTPRWDWTRADSILSRPFDVQGRPRLFPLDAKDVFTLPNVVRERFPSAQEGARRAADRILEGRLTLLGYSEINVGSPIDWHRDPVHDRRAPRRFWSGVPYLDPALGDHKIIWEINRHQHWLTLARAAWLTSDRTYIKAIVSQLDSWLDDNPPLLGINWSSMLELAFRTLSWMWVMPFLLSDADEPRTWLPRMLLAIDTQLEHVRHNLSHYFSPNTHLLGEALSLYVAGRALPELRRSTLWASTGRGVLLEQIHQQILPDGGHAELSTHYHRYALDFYLLALSVARLSGDDAVIGRFEDASRKLAHYARALSDDRGRLPVIGDDDGGQLFPICRREPADATPSLAWAAALLDDPSFAIEPASPPEEAYWLVGADPSLTDRVPDHRPAHVQLEVFPDSGYAVARTTRGDHVVLDTGRHGFLNGGHAHDDALSCVVTLGRKPLLIDPGTSTYTMDASLRDRMRSSTAHNTATLDGRPHSEPSGPFHWRTRADAAPIGSARLSQGIWMAGWHEAFAPLTHRRDIFISDDGLVVFVDSFVGDTSSHLIEVRWTLDRAWEYYPARSGARLIHRAGAEARVVSTAALEAVHGSAAGGWCAPIYGQLLPTWTLIGRLRAQMPAHVITTFSDASVPPAVTAAKRSSELIVTVQRQGREDVIAFGPTGASHDRHVASSVQGRHASLVTDH
jgi:hypothetical protein